MTVCNEAIAALTAVHGQTYRCDSLINLVGQYQHVEKHVKYVWPLLMMLSSFLNLKNANSRFRKTLETISDSLICTLNLITAGHCFESELYINYRLIQKKILTEMSTFTVCIV